MKRNLANFTRGSQLLGHFGFMFAAGIKGPLIIAAVWRSRALSHSDGNRLLHSTGVQKETFMVPRTCRGSAGWIWRPPTPSAGSPGRREA
jgi:hypothetical protein